MKRIISLGLCLVMMMGMTGCGSSAGTASGTSGEKTLSLSDVQWKMDSAIQEGHRRILCTFTNNSTYTIKSIGITFAQKSGLTDKDRKVFDDLINEQGWTKEDIKELTMHAETEKFIEAGKTSKQVPLEAGFTYIDTMAKYKVMTPDVLTVEYIDGENIKTDYYDYVNKKWNNDKTVKKHQWSTGALAQLVPEIKDAVISVEEESDSRFLYYIYNFSLSDFDDYVAKCKKNGFTKGIDSYKYSDSAHFSAKDAKGNEVDLTLDDTDVLTVYVDAK